MTSSLCVIDGVSELDPLLRETAEAWKATALADPVAFYTSITPLNYSSSYTEANAAALAKRKAVVAGLPREYLLDFAALCDAFLEINLTSQLSRISCPTLVLVGEKDIVKHEGFARIIADSITGSRIQVVPCAGYDVVIEQPEAVLARSGSS
jgi:3-oxoadipate enol-lactonase